MLDWIPVAKLKESYEIVGESRPLSDFFPTHADFFLQKCISNHDNPPSFRAIRAIFTIDV